jgi:hypothetical protein
VVDVKPTKTANITRIVQIAPLSFVEVSIPTYRDDGAIYQLGLAGINKPFSKNGDTCFANKH